MKHIPRIGTGFSLIVVRTQICFTFATSKTGEFSIRFPNRTKRATSLAVDDCHHNKLQAAVCEELVMRILIRAGFSDSNNFGICFPTMVTGFPKTNRVVTFATACV
jgi:hypothetical protein